MEGHAHTHWIDAVLFRYRTGNPCGIEVCGSMSGERECDRVSIESGALPCAFNTCFAATRRSSRRTRPTVYRCLWQRSPSVSFSLLPRWSSMDTHMDLHAKDIFLVARPCSVDNMICTSWPKSHCFYDGQVRAPPLDIHCVMSHVRRCCVAEGFRRRGGTKRTIQFLDLSQTGYACGINYQPPVVGDD